MSERTDALEELLDIIERTSFRIGIGEGNLNIRLERDAARGKIIAEIAGIEAERDEARTEGWMLRELARMEREALIGASKEVERILRARITELEAAATNLCGDLRIWHDNGMYECYSLSHSIMELVLMRTPPAPEANA